MIPRKRSRIENLHPHPTPFGVDGLPLRKTKERTFIPEMNLYKYVDERTGLDMTTVMIGLPGLQPGDVTINLLHNKLTISGQAFEPLLGKDPYVIREIDHGNFSRVVTVPLGMRLRDFKASMENGLLMVTFPKEPPEQKALRIPIESPVLDIHDD